MNIDYEMGEVVIESVDLCLAELLKRKPYICKTWAEPQANEKNDRKSRNFSFDITKVDAIFDQLYKDKQISLSNRHTLPTAEQIGSKNIVKGTMHGLIQLIIFLFFEIFYRMP